MKKHILIVTKDMMGFKTFYPVAERLDNRGHRVSIVAEGASLPEWRSSSFKSSLYGSPDPKLDSRGMRQDIDAISVLSELCPNVVMTEMSWPINLSRIFGLAANDLRIPLGYVEDITGSWRRSNAVPDFICAQDELIFRSLLDLDSRGKTEIFVTGNPSVDSLLTLPINPFLQEMKEHHGLVIFLQLQDQSSLPMVEGLWEALSNRNNQSSVLIYVQFHRKYQDLTEESVSMIVDPNDKAEFTAIEVCYRKIRQMVCKPPLNCKVMFVGADVKPEEIIASSDFLVTIFSNSLRDAVVLKTLAISWVSPLAVEQMQKKISSSHYELVELGAVVELSTIGEFLSLPYRNLDYYTLVRNAGKLVPSDGRNTRRVVDAILRHAK